MSQVHRLVSNNLSVLSQARDLLVGIDPDVYAKAEDLPVKSGAGEHVRHCLDFYDSLLHGLPERRIDYGNRERDELTARDPAWAAARIEATMRMLEEITIFPASMAVLVRPDGPADAGESADWARSSVARELQFLLSHTIHHFALIGLLLRLQGIEPGAEFGVAPSTLAHWRNGS